MRVDTSMERHGGPGVGITGKVHMGVVVECIKAT